MSKDPAKDFGSIADDYAFFETNATEAAEDSRAYVERLAGLLPDGGPIRFLDFGCGSGTFTLRFLQQTGWPAARLRMTLVEPVDSARCRAAEVLAAFSDLPIADSPVLPGGTKEGLDVILANHVLYYVPDLRQQLSALVEAVAPNGVFLTAIAARTNVLIEIWIAGFHSLGREVPYNTSEDVDAALRDTGVGFQKQEVPYVLEFPDSEENRMRILRFLLAEHLGQMPVRPLLELFDRHAAAGRIRIQTASDHYTIRRSDSRQ